MNLRAKLVQVKPKYRLDYTQTDNQCLIFGNDGSEPVEVKSIQGFYYVVAEPNDNLWHLYHEKVRYDHVNVLEERDTAIAGEWWIKKDREGK